VTTLPGSAVGGGFAVTDGGNEPMFTFSDGDTAGPLVLAGDVSAGFSSDSVLLQAVRVPAAAMAIVAAPRASRGKPDFMGISLG
jgi:hypothetical protein